MDASAPVQRDTSPLPPRKKGLAASLRVVFLWVFAAVFAVLIASAVFANPFWAHYQPLAVLLLAAAFAAVFFGVAALCRRFEAFLTQREIWCLLAFWALLTLTQLLFYSQLAVYPSRDFERVFTGAVNFAVNGFIEEPYLDYFYKFPNNMPATILLQFVFRIGNRLGFRDFYLIGSLVGALCYQLNFLFTYLCTRRLLGVARGFTALGVLWLCLPLHCLIGVFYTDTLTLPFIPLGLYLYLRLRDAAPLPQKLLWAALLGGALGLGTKIKYSVVILLVALLIDALLAARWKDILLAAAGFGLFFALISAGFNSYMYAHFLDKSLAADRATPFVAWIMMGMQGDGAHNVGDNDYIWAQPTREEKQQAAVEELERRLDAHTPGSFLAFMWQKSQRSYGSGNLDYTALAADSPRAQTFLVECVSPSGRHYAVFDNITQGYYVALFLCVIASAVACARKKSFDLWPCYLAMFGMFLFLLLWESGQRYLLNYYAMYILAALPVLERLPFRRRPAPAPEHAP